MADHGGGSQRLHDQIFRRFEREDPSYRAAGARDDAMSILIGIVARKSIESGQPIQIASLTDLQPRTLRLLQGTAASEGGSGTFGPPWILQRPAPEHFPFDRTREADFAAARLVFQRTIRLAARPPRTDPPHRIRQLLQLFRRSDSATPS